MRAAVANGPVIKHAIQGRVRLHVPGWSGELPSQLEHRLCQVSGVRMARARPLTGSILVYFDPQRTDPQQVRDALCHLLPVIREENAARSLKPATVHPKGAVAQLDRLSVGRPPRTDEGLLVLGLAGAVRLVELRELLGGPLVLARLVKVIAYFLSVSPVRPILRRRWGQTVADLCCAAVDLLVDVLAGSPLGALAAAMDAYLRLTKASSLPILT
jgi:hypothetical protein